MVEAMNTLCAGLAILGLCVPLPGESKARVEAADWPVVADSALDWGVQSSMASNDYRLLVSIWGHGQNVVGVLIEESAQEPPRSERVSKLSRLDQSLSKMCSGTTGEKCSHSGVGFNRVPCNGGWMLLTLSESTIEAKASCKELQRIFEQFPRDNETRRKSSTSDSAKRDAGSR